MQRELNPYAQYPAYTVTQTMAISVPSVVAEDVLDGEDMGGGGSSIDSSTLVALQSDMVELKSGIADLTSQLYTFNDDVKQLTSQCVELKDTTVAANYKGNSKSDLTLTINGNNGSLYLSAKDAYDNTITQLDRYALQVTLADLYDEDARYTFVNGVLSKSTNEGVSWDPISSSSSGSNNQVLSINGLDALSFSHNYDTRGAIVVQGSTTDVSGLAYYPLATSSFANVDSIACQMKPVSNGIAYSNDYGNTWTTITATSGSGSGSDSGSSSGSIILDDSISKFLLTYEPISGTIVSHVAIDGSSLGYYALGAAAFTDAAHTDYMMKPVSGGIAYSNDYGKTWTTITASSGSDSGSSSSESLVLDGALTKVYMSAQTYSEPRESVIELAATLGTAGSSQQYALAVPAIANSASPGAQMRPTMNGIETSLDYGKTWNVLSPSNSSNSVTCDDSIGKVVFTKTNYDSIAIAANVPYNSSELAYYGLVTPFIYNATTNTYLRSSLVGNNPVAQVSSDGSDWTTIGGSATTVDGAANKLVGYIKDNSNELSTALDYQLCLGKDSSGLPYIVASNDAGNSWAPLQMSVHANDRQRLDTITISVEPPIFNGSSQNTYKLVGASRNFDRHLEFSSTIVDQLDTSAGAISLSNMVWLSDNASRLAALLYS